MRCTRNRKSFTFTKTKYHWMNNTSYVNSLKMAQKQSNLKRRKVFIFIVLLLSSSNSLNGSKDVSNFSKNLNKSDGLFNTSGNISNPKEKSIDDHFKPKNEQIGNLFIALATLILLISTTLFLILWSYLDSVSTAKRCFLLYLYQDIIELALISSWFWFGLVMDCYFRGNGATLNKTDSIIFSVALVGFQLELGILATLAGMIKVYQMKQNQLDPPLPCDVDEQTVNRVIQLALVTTIHLILVLMSLEGIHPHLYYRFVGENKTFFELSLWSRILKCLVVFFFLCPLLTLIFDCCYRKTENQTFGLTMERKFQSAVFFLVFVTIISLLVTQFSPKFKNFLIIGELLVIVACVIAPLYIIVTSPSLRRFSLNELSNVLSLVIKPFEFFLKCLKSSVECRKRSRQIAPIV